MKFFKADGSLLTGVVVGKSRESGQGAYVRLASSNDVYLTNEAPLVRTRALDYVNQEIASVKREDVNAVTVTTPEGTYTLRAEKDGGDDVIMDGMPADKKLKATDVKSVFTALQGLRFDDVNAPAQIQGLIFDHKYVARMDDSTEYTLELAQKGEKTYLIARAAYTSPRQGDDRSRQAGFAGGTQEERGDSPGPGGRPEIHPAAQGLGLSDSRVEGEAPADAAVGSVRSARRSRRRRRRRHRHKPRRRLRPSCRPWSPRSSRIKPAEPNKPQ